MAEQIQIGVETRLLTGDGLEAQVERVVKSASLGEREREVLRVLASHRGAANAIKGQAILHVLDMQVNEQSRRWLKGVMEDLVVFHKVKVGALRMKPFGYFLVVTANDLDLAIQPLWGEVYALLRRLRALTSKKDVARLFGQAQLQFDQSAEKLSPQRTQGSAEELRV